MKNVKFILTGQQLHLNAAALAVISGYKIAKAFSMTLDELKQLGFNGDDYSSEKDTINAKVRLRHHKAFLDKHPQIQST